jgi:hypothetical protein
MQNNPIEPDGGDSGAVDGSLGAAESGTPSAEAGTPPSHAGNGSPPAGGGSGSSGTGGAGGAGGMTAMAGSGSDTAGMAGGTAGGMAMEPPKEPCTSDGALRCSTTRAAGERDHCTGGFWMPSDACKVGEICRAQPGPMDGMCQMVAEICRGSAGQPVCDSQGVMYQCTPDGVIESQADCTSAKHCQMGIATKKCLMCIPGEFRCTETKLEKCGDDGQAFAMDKECPTAALCNAKVGDCTDAACVPNKQVCEGDKLRKCNDDQTGLVDVKPCMPGLCDNAAGECDVCVAGAKSCEGDTVVTCNAQGQGTTRVACSGATAQCVGAGQCVACAADADCGDPGACKTRHCNLATGACAPQNVSNGGECSTGVCKDGGCVACLEPSDCEANPGTCKVKGCSSANACVPQNARDGSACNSTDVCNGGTCVACRVPEDCDANPGQCKVKGCSANGTCTPGNAPNGSDCQIGSRPGVCSGGTCVGCSTSNDCTRISPDRPYCTGAGGSCVECTAPSQCPGGTCRRATCTGGECGSEITAWAECAPGNVCDAGGICDTACPNGHIDSNEECELNVNGWSTLTCEGQSCRRLYYRTCTANAQCTENSCGATGGMCSGGCGGGGGCPASPPGGATSVCYDNQFCALTCDNTNECPKGLTCTDDSYTGSGAGDPNPRRGVCVGNPGCCTVDFGCFGCFWPSGA